jgi:hypothetical protein
MNGVPTVPRNKEYVLNMMHHTQKNYAAMKGVLMKLSKEEYVSGTGQRKRRERREVLEGMDQR